MTWRGAKRRIALVLLVMSPALACSLFTDFGGLDDGSPKGDPPSTTSDTGRGGIPTDDGGNPIIVPIDGAAGDAGPYHPKFQRRFTIRNNASTTLVAGTTQCFIVAPPTAGSAGVPRPDFGDVRIFGATTERLRVIDVRDQVISMCFALERAIAPASVDSYFVRYDDPNANAPAPAEADLFPFWESFDGTQLDTNRWLVNGTATVSSGVLTVPRGATNAIASKPAQDGVPTLASLEIRLRVTDPASAPGIQDTGEEFYYWFGFQHKGDFIAAEPWSVFIGRVPNVIRAEHKGIMGTTCFGNCVGPDKSQRSDFRTYRIDRAQTETIYTADDNVPFKAAGTNGDESIIVRNFALTSDVVVDWIRARPIVEPAPTVDVGPEEAAPP